MTTVSGSGLLSFGGLASGLDTKSIVDALMQADSASLTTLQNKQAQIQQRNQAYQDINTRVAALQAAAYSLTLANTVNAKSATVSDPAVLSASAGSAAVNTSFSVTVQRLATASRISSDAVVGSAVNAAASLTSGAAGFSITPTAGTFTLRTITGGVTTSQSITLDANTVLSDGVDDAGSNSILGKINAAGLGITASIQPDALGRGNYLRLTTAAGTQLQVGSGADTSNFLTAARIKDAIIQGDPATQGNTLTSFTPLAGANLSAAITDPAARLRTPIAGLDGANSGSFTINGVSIQYTGNDSVSAILSKINSSNAGVTAAYDPLSDTMSLVATKTGADAISLQDVTGNALAALGLSGTTQTLGVNALYTVDGVNGGQQLSSTSNTVSGIIPGVTLELKSQSPTPVKVTLGQDADATVKAVNDFISAYNDALQTMQGYTKIDPTGKDSGILSSDTSVFDFQQTLRSRLLTPALGATTSPKSLSDLGFNFGRVGSQVGTTDTLALDETKLRAQLQQNPNAVVAAMTGFINSAALSGAGSIASISGTPSVNHRAGTYSIVTAADGTITSTFTPTGGIAETAVSGLIAANGSNSSLIPGLTLTAGALLADSTQTITVGVQTRGAMVFVNDFLRDATSVSGLFKSRQDAGDDAIRDLDKQIQDTQDRLDLKRKSLEAKYAALETTMIQLQQASSSLGSTISQWSKSTG